MPKKPIKREEEAPIDAIRLVLKTQAVQLSRMVDQLHSDLPQDEQLEYYFVPMQYMDQYKAYYRPGKPFKNLKLINYNKPAISLSFFHKHKYSIERTVAHADVVQHIMDYRHELLDRSLTQQLSIGQQKELKQTDEILREIREQPEAYQACFSNYHHKYYYWYCTYRYFDDLASLKATTSSEHLLKHTERLGHEVHERLNIIFIDPVYIRKPVANDHKLIDRELETYPIQLRQGITTLYLRRSQ